MSLPGLLFDNPVLMRELRRRMRQRTTIIVFLLYLAAMCYIAWQTITWRTAMYNMQSMGGYSSYGPTGMRISDIGSTVYTAILSLQAFLVLAIAPSITSGMVKGEKERETFEFLRATTITPLAYLMGALMSSLLLVGLSLLCAFPVLSLALLYGGVQGLVPAVLTLLAISMLLSSQGLMFSAAAEKLRTTSGQNGGMGFGMGIGFFAFFVMFSSMARTLGSIGAGFLLTPVSVFAIPLWVLICAGCTLGTSLWMLIAHRKFFDPSERALNPGQFFGVWLVAFAFAGAIAASPLLSGAPVTASGKVGALTVPLIVALAGGVLAAPVFLPTRLRMGDERWHQRNRNPRLRNTDDPLRHTILAQVFSLLLLGSMLTYIFFESVTPTVLLLIIVGMMFATINMFTRMFLYRTPLVSQAGTWSRSLVIALIAVPLFLITFRSAGTDNMELNLVIALSPVGALSIASDSRLGAHSILSVLVVAAAIHAFGLVILALIYRNAKDAHAVEVVAYDDGTVERGTERGIGPDAGQPRLDPPLATA